MTSEPHHHGHHHTPKLRNLNRAFIAGIVLNLLFVIIEVIAGFYTDSLGLLTDAGHNLSDVASLALALLAYKLAKIKASETYTYGYQKTTILAALANAVILLIAIGSIGWEAVQRIYHPEPVHGKVVALVAGAGILINSVSAFFFFKDKEHDLNVKGAYLHLMADALVSLGVVLAGLAIMYTQWYWLDTLVSFVIIIVIFWSTWRLLKETIRLSLDGVPGNVDLPEIQAAIKKIPGIKSIHHLHIWALSTTQNALTAHVVLALESEPEKIKQAKDQVKHALAHLNIQHVTLETEFAGENCETKTC
jgi:cobalt-zinc-cadmium efflux system protein